MRATGILVLSLLAGPALSQQTSVEGGQTPGAAPAPAADESATPAAGPADGREGGTEAGRGGGKVAFRTVIGERPMALDMRPDQEITPAVEVFHRTGVNPYTGDAAAIADGKKVYAQFCQMCHLPTGEGRIGPSLKDDRWNHPRLDTEVGRFEIIYGGGAGAMQAFGRRIDQDQILKVMAYIDTFRGG